MKDRFHASSASHERLRSLTQCALAAALLCVLSPLSIPIGIIPVSLSLLGVLSAGILLGPWRGACSVLVYLLIGAVGLPVFSGGLGGFHVLAGPTGGYLLSYPLVTLTVGALTQCCFRVAQKKKRLWLTVLCQLPGLAICYLLGSLYYAFVTHISVFSAFGICALPFLPFDLLKCVVAAILGISLKKRIGN